ncbi:MAG: hypothetical protein ACRCXX_13740 [Cetobacterium sp.]|uniref:hypothetical protein n=1 Tax=Cetobacterium sp. TaxID=2071632 RepID=UPI003F34C2DC
MAIIQKMLFGETAVVGLSKLVLKSGELYSCSMFLSGEDLELVTKKLTGLERDSSFVDLFVVATEVLNKKLYLSDVSGFCTSDRKIPSFKMSGKEISDMDEFVLKKNKDIAKLFIKMMEYKGGAKFNIIESLK